MSWWYYRCSRSGILYVKDGQDAAPVMCSLHLNCILQPTGRQWEGSL